MSVAESAKRVYEEDLRSKLELEHKDDFVAIEPSSRSYFLGKTFLEVAVAAKDAYPDRKSFVIRVGHEAELEDFLRERVRHVRDCCVTNTFCDNHGRRERSSMLKMAGLRLRSIAWIAG